MAKQKVKKCRDGHHHPPFGVKQIQNPYAGKHGRQRDARALGPSPGFETERRFTLSKRVTLTPPLGWPDRPDAALWPGNPDRLARHAPNDCPPL